MTAKEKGQGGTEQSWGADENIGVAQSHQFVPLEWPNLCPFHANIGISFSGQKPYCPLTLERLSRLHFSPHNEEKVDRNDGVWCASM